jgi:hypothetical protein
MSAPLAGEVGARSAPGPGVIRFLGLGGFSVASPRHVRSVRLVVDDHHEALTRGVVAPGAGVVGVAERVVRDVEEPLEHHRVRHAGEVPFCVPMRSGRWQLAGGAVVGLVVGGGDEVPGRQEVVARKVLVRHHIGAGRRGICRRGIAHPVGESRLGNRALPPGCGCRLADGRVTLRGDTRCPASFHPRLSTALDGASSASWC